MTDRPAAYTEQITSFLVMDILEEALELERAGEQVIHMEVGEPDFATPDCIAAAAQRAMQAGVTRYTHSQGMLELREAICREYRARYGVDVAAQQVIVTSGSSPALLLILAALIEPGDEVLVPDPGYACYPNFVRFVRGRCVPFAVRAEDGFVYDPQLVKRMVTARTKAIMVNSPSNPTGAVLPGEVLAELARLGCIIISDEIYHGLSYGVEEHCILEYTDRAFVLNGFSKRYAMTGWRLGYAIAPPQYVRAMQKLQQNLFICASAFVQAAGIAALQEAAQEAEQMRQTYDRRRKYLVPAVQGLGFGVAAEPQGAYYVLADARHLSNDSLSLARELLRGAKVAVTPGVDFGRNAEGYIRFSYANSLDRLQQGIEALRRYLQNRR